MRSPGAARAANDVEPPAGSGSWEAARAGSRADLEAGHGSARAGSWEDPAAGATERTLTGRELLLGSSFHLTAGGGEAGGPALAAWGRMRVGGFDTEAPAEKGTVHLDGEVTTGILGADAEWERWLAGVALSVSSAEGTFDQPGVDSGTVESTLTSVNPYVRYEASDRLTAWGLLGYGTGDMTIRGKSPVRTVLMMRLGAAGARGVLLEAGEDGGIDLALRGDAFLVQMESEAAANTVETKADASRLRLVLEAGRSFALGEGAVLAPALELGLRHDGGDAETGTGVEVGGRIRYTDAGSGLTVEANARTLIAHEDSGYREWGAGGSVRLDPGASGRGLSLALAPVWGTPSSGVDRLWSARDAAGLAPGGEFEAERRLEGRDRLRLRRVRRARPGDALCGSRAGGGRGPDVARGRALVARAAPRDEPRRHAARAGERQCAGARGAVPVHAPLVGAPVRRRSGLGRGVPVAAWRRAALHSEHVRNVGLQEASDHAVWEYARSNGFAAFSKDEDFHQLSFLRGPPPKVVWAKLGNCTTDDVERGLRERQPDLLELDNDEDAAFAVVAGGTR